MSQPYFDHALIHRANTIGSGAAVHQLANYKSAYESAWANGEENGWDRENAELLLEAERELRKYLNQFR